MKRRTTAAIVIAAVIGISLIAPLAAWASPDSAPRSEPPLAAASTTPAGRPDRVEGRILIRFRSGVSGTLAARFAHARVGGKTMRRYRVLEGLELVELPPGISVDVAVAAYGTMPEVLYAQPDYVVHVAATPNDTFYGFEWGLNNTGQPIMSVTGTPDADIDAPEAWDITTGSDAVVVAVVDTGVNYTHPDLAANMWTNSDEIPANGIDDDANGFIDDVRGLDTFNGDVDPMDDYGHGTHCAGTIGAVGNNATGVAGVNWDVRIMPVKAFNASGASTTSTTLAAMEYAYQEGADVISCSWGGWYPLVTGADSEHDAIAAMGDRLFVFAAGNEGKDITNAWPGGTIGGTYYPPNPSWFFYPAGYDLANIISVGASDQNDARASFSNYSSTRVDVFAPGVNIASTKYDGYYYNSGTSMATPHVAGLAALMLSCDATLTDDQLKTAIMGSVDLKPQLSGLCVTGGRINARAAVASVGNRPPLPVADTVVTDEDVAKTVDVLANDTDPDADPLTPALVTQPAHGAATINPDQTVTYTPEPNWSGADSFRYRVTDGRAESSESTVSVTVDPVNDAPSFTKGDDVTVAEDCGPRTVAGWVISASPGPLETTQTVSFGITNDNGALFSAQPAVAPDGTLSFTPAANAFGTATVAVTPVDSLALAGAPQTFMITVDPLNDAPSFTKGPDVAVAEDCGPRTVAGWATSVSPGPLETTQTVTFDLTNDNNALFSAQPAVTSDGTLSFTPAADAFGTATVTVTPVDSLALAGAPQSFVITVSPVNDAPVASVETTTTDEDVPKAINVLANDVDVEGDALTPVVVAPPTHGSASVNPDGTVDYAPTANYYGADSFTYKATDGTAESDAVTVSITVTAVNDAPVASAETTTTNEDVEKTIDVLANDSDPDGEALTPVVVAPPTHGSASVNPDGTVFYKPTADYYGADSFTYKASDGLAESGVVTVSLTVSPVNDLPSFTKGDDVRVVEDSGTRSITGWVSSVSPGPNESDQSVAFELTPDAPALFSTPPAIGAFGTLSFTPAPNANGTTTVTIIVTDSAGASSAQTFTITVTAENDAPVGVPDSYNVTAGSPLVVPARGVLSNDTDIDSAELSAQLVTGPSQGALTLNPDGSFTYTPGAGVHSTSDSFSYQAKDGTAVSGPTTVSLAIGASPAPTPVLTPVYRFFSPRSGTHFYTPTASERDHVIATWPDVWSYEGVAYVIDLNKNPQPLYRFYNRGNGSHFYTASDSEANTVMTAYAAVFQYDGRSYPVSPSPEAGKTPVYRFFNLRNGSHFYTASETERDHVIATWPDVYRLEGPAFWLGQ